MLFALKYINSHKFLDVELKINQFLFRCKRINKCKSFIHGSTVQSKQTALVDSSIKEKASEMLFLTILMNSSEVSADKYERQFPNSNIGKKYILAPIKLS